MLIWPVWNKTSNVREAYRRFVLLQRSAAADKAPRDQKVAAERATAKTETFPDVVRATP